jgi:hypothetical protein
LVEDNESSTKRKVTRVSGEDRRVESVRTECTNCLVFESEIATHSSSQESRGHNNRTARVEGRGVVVLKKIRVQDQWRGRRGKVNGRGQRKEREEP